jgi:predicted secreted protein
MESRVQGIGLRAQGKEKRNEKGAEESAPFLFKCLPHFMGGTKGMVIAKYQHRKKTGGMWMNICRTE